MVAEVLVVVFIAAELDMLDEEFDAVVLAAADELEVIVVVAMAARLAVPPPIVVNAVHCDVAPAG